IDHDDIRSPCHEFRCIGTQAAFITGGDAKIEMAVAPLRPTQFCHFLIERLPDGSFQRVCSEEANLPDPTAFLGVDGERPSRRSAEKRDELAPLNHSITSSASASSVGG